MCPTCQVGRQLVGNRHVALRPEELARAFCDAQWIDVTGQQRAVQDRSAANIEVHHIVPQELGGPHTLDNLIALCDGHHVAHHRGDITIEGPAESAVIVNIAAQRADVAATADEIVHVDNRSDQPALRAAAVLALTTLGHAKGEARRAVDAALDDEPTSLEELVRGALRRCAAGATTRRDGG